METDQLIFGACHVQDRNRFRVIAQTSEMIEAGAPDAFILSWYRNGSTPWSHFYLKSGATRFGMINTENGCRVGIANVNGSVAITNPTTFEVIDETGNGPDRHGLIMDIAGIGDHFYTAGMSRQAYRREVSGKWVHIDEGCLQAQSRDYRDIAGFITIAGLAGNNIYTAGFGGEIWHYDGARWQQLPSPTSTTLNQIKIVRSGLIYIAGNAGILVRYHSGQWQAARVIEDQDNIESIEWFDNRLYLTTGKALYTLAEDGELAQVDTNLGNVTYGYLHANNGTLLSSGPDHIIYTDDGTTWYDITPKEKVK